MTGNEPLVSVIIPVFNGECYITETITSVINQSYGNWEMVIVDDCSADKSAIIAEGFCRQDTRIKLIRSPVRLGNPAKPRNIGIKNARGKYVAFLDADDMWLKDKLKIQVAYLESHPDIYLLYSRYLVSRNGKIDNRVMPQERKMNWGKTFNSLFIKGNFIGTLAVIMRNEREFLFDEDRELTAIEDYDLWLRISQTETIDFIDEPLAVYRVHRNCISLDIPVLIRRYIYFLNKWRKRVPPGIMALKYIFSFGYICKLFGKNLLSKTKKLLFRQ